MSTFGGNARVSETGRVSGQQEYRDHGPAQPMRVRSTTVSSVPCVIDTSGGNGEPGRGRDTYHIQLSNGYDSGVKTLQAGNIQVQRAQTAG